jgi:uncharacterized protein
VVEGAGLENRYIHKDIAGSNPALSASQGMSRPSQKLVLMNKKTVARWQNWSGESIEHLALTEATEGVWAEAVIIGKENDNAFAAQYTIACDTEWRVRKVNLSLIGNDREVKLASDGLGNWSDQSGALPKLKGAIDIDISATPFTNTLPIRRLKLQTGQSANILVVYIQLPELHISIDSQRYTCLETNHLYRFESLDGDFVRNIETADNGLVVTYPGLFQRVDL